MPRLLAFTGFVRRQNLFRTCAYARPRREMAPGANRRRFVTTMHSVVMAAGGRNFHAKFWNLGLDWCERVRL